MGEKKGTGNPEDFQPTRRNLEYSGTIDQLISLFQIAGLWMWSSVLGAYYSKYYNDSFNRYSTIDYLFTRNCRCLIISSLGLLTPANIGCVWRRTSSARHDDKCIKKSLCVRIGPRHKLKCSNIVASDSNVISWSNTIRYSGVNIVARHKFTCSLDNKRSFYRAFNAIFGKVAYLYSDRLRRRYNWTVES